MSTLAFAVDVVVTAGVLGADHTCGPDQVSAILGTTPAENRQRKVMWRDHGLVEFFWERHSGGLPWVGTHFTVQIHRLVSTGPQIAAAPIQAKYGPLEPVLPFDALLLELTNLGAELAELPGASPGYREYWQPDSLVSVLVVDSGTTATGQAGGTVYAITAPLRAVVAAARTQGDTAAARQQRIDHLLHASEPQRLAWIARHQPKQARPVNWWLGLFVEIEARVRDHRDLQADTIRLYMWTVGRAQDAGVLSPAETAIRIAHLVAALHYSGDADALADVLPSAGEIVRDCLAAVPITVDQDAAPCDLSTSNLDTMRASRRAKNLINAATPHLDRLHDLQLAAELKQWIAVRTNLV